MATDLFEQLADLDVPPVPAALDREVHERVNKGLLLSQYVDLFLYGVPYAFGHFARAVAHLCVLTLTGRGLSVSPRKPSRDEDGK